MPDQRGALESERIHEFQHELLAPGVAQIVGRIALAESRHIHCDGANTLRSKRAQVAPEDISRGAERTAVQQDRRGAAAFLQIADLASVDSDEAVIDANGDVHDRDTPLVTLSEHAAG